MTNELRDELEYIVKLPIHCHVAEIEECLKQRFSHTIEPLDYKDPKVNCVMFALNMVEWTDWPIVYNIEIQGILHEGYHADTKLVEHLIEKKLFVECKNDCANYVIYFDKVKKITHIGLIAKSGKAQSKWGRGLAYEHNFIEVSSNYGSPSFYRISSTKRELIKTIENYLILEKNLSKL